ncbi:hypothetical protein FACS189444_2120 [Spirochaetia bacterium]|nr:hypothetical protein FACS189444_2120 [Spirochaetia bacterium]
MTESVLDSTIDIRNGQALLASPMDIQVYVLSIPMLKRKNHEELIREQIKNLYPGDIDTILLDYTLPPIPCSAHSGTTAAVTAFGVAPELLASYRALRKPVIPGIRIMAQAAGNSTEQSESKLVILFNAGCVEIARFEDNAAARYIASRLENEGENIPFLSRFYSEEERNTLPVLYIYPSSHAQFCEGYITELSKIFHHLSPIDLTEAAAGINLRKAAIFNNQKERTRKAHRVIISALILLNFALVVFFIHSASDTVKATLTNLKATYMEQSANTKEAAELKKEIATFDQIPQITMYRIFSEFCASLHGAWINTMTIRSDGFILEAEGADSIEVLLSLQQTGYFSGLVLHQASPSKIRGEQFSISGSINHDKQ